MCICCNLQGIAGSNISFPFTLRQHARLASQEPPLAYHDWLCYLFAQRQWQKDGAAARECQRSFLAHRVQQQANPARLVVAVRLYFVLTRHCEAYKVAFQRSVIRFLTYCNLGRVGCFEVDVQPCAVMPCKAKC